MAKPHKKTTRVRSAAAALATGFSLVAASSNALAVSDGVPLIVEYVPPQPGANLHTLLIQVNGVNYYSKTGSMPTACSGIVQAASLDTIKLQLSIAQAALLAGKELRVYNTACGGTEFFTTIDIWR